ncbi:MAG: hypothetical protein J5367_02785 [Lachnospiraceae bacterium]|nr:hypothetical protein [Lachnospiraceae bacterium]
MRVSDLFVSGKTEDTIKQLYTGREAARRIRIHAREKSVIFAVIAAATVFISVPVFIMDHMKNSEPILQIDRAGYGKGMGHATLRAVSDGYDGKISIEINEREYTKEELERFSEELSGHLWTDILGEDRDAENVTEDLDLRDSMEGYPFKISWKTDRPLILNSRGIIDKDRLEEEDPDDEGLPVRLCATLKYRDYSEDMYGYVIVRRSRETLSEEESIMKAIKESDEAGSTGKVLMLPGEIGGRKITYYNADMNKGWIILIMGFIMALTAPAIKDEKIRKEADERRKQMDSDYPRIINLYALYYTAGMNPRTIWSGICDRYEDGISTQKGSRRYAYEEMIRTRRMMDEGTEELIAYDDFARRCQTVGFRSFISMIRQAVTKGNDGLDRILKEEMEKALRSRNNMVRIAASEASTKLLFPMFMMLAVVLAVVMIPAFIGMRY